MEEEHNEEYETKLKQMETSFIEKMQMLESSFRSEMDALKAENYKLKEEISSDKNGAPPEEQNSTPEVSNETGGERTELKENGEGEGERPSPSEGVRLSQEIRQYSGTIGRGAVFDETIEDEINRLAELLEAASVELQEKSKELESSKEENRHLKTIAEEYRRKYEEIHSGVDADRRERNKIVESFIAFLKQTGHYRPPSTNRPKREELHDHMTMQAGLDSLQAEYVHIKREYDALSRRFVDTQVKLEETEAALKEISKQNQQLSMENSLAVEQIATLRVKLENGDQQKSMEDKPEVKESPQTKENPTKKESTAKKIAEERDGRNNRRKSASATRAGRKSPTPAAPKPSSAITERILRSLNRPSQSETAKLVDVMVEDLKTAFEGRGVELPLKKVADFKYQLGESKKIHLNVLSGKLVVRAGGGFQDLLEYLDRTRF